MKIIQSIETNLIPSSQKLVHEFEKVICDPMGGGYLIFYRLYEILRYSRRVLAYETGYSSRRIFIRQNMDAFKDLTKEETINYLADNWADCLQLYYNGLYQNDIIASTRGDFCGKHLLETLDEVKREVDRIGIDGGSIPVYNGYNGNFETLISKTNLK